MRRGCFAAIGRPRYFGLDAALGTKTRDAGVGRQASTLPILWKDMVDSIRKMVDEQPIFGLIIVRMAKGIRLNIRPTPVKLCAASCQDSRLREV